MRNFRTAAVASATALTVLAGGIATASAQNVSPSPSPSAAAPASDSATPNTTEPTTGKAEKSTETTPVNTVANDKQVIFVGKVDKNDKAIGDVISDSIKGGSSKAVNDADKAFFITDAFGQKTNAEDVPQWARIWIDATVVAGIGALLGLVIAGVNFASYNGWIQLPSF